MIARTTGSPLALKIGEGLFVLIGTIFIVVSFIIRGVDEQRATERTATAKATIIDVKEEVSYDSDGDRHVSHYPVLSFTDSDGISYEGEQTVSSGNYEIGEVVEIEYDPYHPTENLIMARDKHASGLLTTVFLVVGIVSVLLGLIMFIFV